MRTSLPLREGAIKTASEGGLAAAIGSAQSIRMRSSPKYASTLVSAIKTVEFAKRAWIHNCNLPHRAGWLGYNDR
jgi:hypothetical protein